MKQPKPILLPTEKFELSTDFRRYFIEEDALAHLTAELVFSIFRRYRCQAGCSMCYIRDQWINEDVFAAEMIPNITSGWETNVLRVFDMFDVVSTMDDLFMLNRDYPELFEFYRANAHRMSLTSMTDVALFQQAPLLGPSGLLFKSIYEISLSDTFLHRGGGATAVKALEILKQLHSHTPISKSDLYCVVLMIPVLQLVLSTYSQLSHGQTQTQYTLTLMMTLHKERTVASSKRLG